jgi:hypothetical protein
MGLVVIPNQPINLEPFAVDDCNVGDNKAYCTLYNDGDYAYLQFKQTPCGGNIVTEGNFVTVDDWTADAGWTYNANSIGANLDDGTYVHTPGTSDDLEQTVPFVNGNYYKLTITVGNRTAGTVTVSIGGTALDPISSNGEFTLYGTASSSGVLTITADSAFDGYVAYVSAYELVNTYQLVLLDADTETPAAVQPSITSVYDDEYVTLYWQWSGVPMGCYKVSVGDPCNPGAGASLVSDPEFDSGSGWNIINDGGTQHLVIAGGVLSLTIETPGDTFIETIESNTFELINGCCYRIEVQFGNVDPAFDSNVAGGTIIGLKSTLLGGSVVNFISGPNSFYENQTFYFDFCVPAFTNPSTDYQLYFTYQAANGNTFTGGEYAEIKKMNIYPIYDCGTGDVTYVSNCLALDTEHDCAKLVRATCDNDTTKYGFRWGAFVLNHRARFLKFNPFYPTDADDYEYSSGTRSLTFAKREKYWEGLLDYADENFHDTVSTQVLCDTIQIDGVSYFVRPGDYKPEWDKDGRQRLAQARIELRKKSSTIQSN